MIYFYPQARKNPKTKATAYHPQIAPVRPLNIEDICEAITQVCTVTRHDIKAVLSALQEEVVKAMLNGHSVRFGDLGSFRPTLSSRGLDTAEKVTAKAIRRVHCRFTPGSLVTSRLALTCPEVTLAPYAINKPASSGSEIL